MGKRTQPPPAIPTTRVVDLDNAPGNIPCSGVEAIDETGKHFLWVFYGQDAHDRSVKLSQKIEAEFAADKLTPQRAAP